MITVFISGWTKGSVLSNLFMDGYLLSYSYSPVKQLWKKYGRDG